MRKILLLMLMSSSAYAQDPDSTSKKLEVRGYIKDLQSLTLYNNFNDLVTGNLIHNRINIKWKPSSHVTGAVELRNRLWWGEEVRLTPNLSDYLRNRNETLNLSNSWIEKQSIVLNTNIDRLWLEYRNTSWNLRLGRQRINWGIGTTWNPNDLFNTYNFLDFDYEERPGSDAAKFQYITGDMSNIEVAIAPSSDSDQTIAAARYFFNVWNYDFQLIGGMIQQQLTLGAGWSGSIQNTGFKGELQYYFAGAGLENQLNVSIEADRIFADGWYASVGVLVNSEGTEQNMQNINLSDFQFSPKNLMPTRYNTLASFSKEITALFSAQASFIYSPGTNLILVLPSLQYNIAQNLDASLVWQTFLAEQGNQLEDLSHRVFLRLKLSF